MSIEVISKDELSDIFEKLSKKVNEVSVSYGAGGDKTGEIVKDICDRFRESLDDIVRNLRAY